MKLHITDAIKKPCSNKFESMLLNGLFPNVNFRESESNGIKWHSYNMLDYSFAWSQFMKWVDLEMKKDIDPSLGVFTRKHSKSVLLKLDEILNTATEEGIYAVDKRFRTMFD